MTRCSGRSGFTDPSEHLRKTGAPFALATLAEDSGAIPYAPLGELFSGIRSTRSVDEGRAVFRYLRKSQSNTVRIRLTIRQVTIGK